MTVGVEDVGVNYPILFNASDANFDSNREPVWDGPVPTMHFSTRETINVVFDTVGDPDNDTVSVSVVERGRDIPPAFLQSAPAERRLSGSTDADETLQFWYPPTDFFMCYNRDR